MRDLMPAKRELRQTMISVLIADDHQLFRDLLEHMLSDNEGIHVIACAKDGYEAIELVNKHHPDVVLMDIDMPACNGVEAIKAIKQEKESSKILVLSASHEEQEISDALSHGADGYVLKDIGKNELILAINSVFAGMEVIRKDVRSLLKSGRADKVRKRGSKTIIDIEGFEIELSQRDLQVIGMIVNGLNTEEMADELYVTEGRVRNIITELISKLMMKDRTQLAVFALKNKLV